MDRDAGHPSAGRRPGVLGGIADAFADANFRRYSVGAIASWLSFFVQAVAVSWVAWGLTHSTGWLAAVALLDAVPMSVLAPVGGIVADRVDRFRLLMVAYVLAAAQSATLALLAFSGHLGIGWLAALTFAHGVIHAFSVPAQFGLLPRFVEPRRLPSAIAVASAYTQLGLFIGPALAGWVIERFGPATAFASNVAGYLVYFSTSALLRTPPGYRSPPPARRGLARDLSEGVRTILAHRGIMALLSLMLCGNALHAAVRQMLPAFADRSLGSGVTGLSTLLSSAGIGATLAALWLAQGGARRSTSDTITWAFLGYVAATAALLIAAGLWSAALAMAGVGFCFEICRTGTLTLLQTSTADTMRGRLMSAQFLLQQGASALGVAAIGAVAGGWGLRLPLLGGTAFALVAWLLAYRARTRVAAAFRSLAGPG